MELKINEQIDDLLAKLSVAESNLSKVHNKQARMDLMRMIKNVDRQISELSKEGVECRRMHKESLRYKELATYTESLLSQLEQYLTYAVLLGDWQVNKINL